MIKLNFRKFTVSMSCREVVNNKRYECLSLKFVDYIGLYIFTTETNIRISTGLLYISPASLR